MNLKGIISSISESEGIPAGQVRKVAEALFEKVAEAVDNGERIAVPGYVFNPRTIPAKEADGDKPARPETKVAIFRRRSVKQDNDQPDMTG
ncbi:HU family DNA-binding protein [Synechococcus sp. AH-603-M21]|nr:HU family DNA-binding protein [Synechococcus sp. AH-603-M21]